MQRIRTSGVVGALLRRVRTGAVLITVAGSTPAAGAAGVSAEALVFNCFTCHGTDGRSPGEIHSISGKSSEFLKWKMTAYKQDQGDATIMNRIARGYTDEEIALIADYIAKLR